MRIALFLASIILSITAQAQWEVLVLGTAQDGGYPQIGCKREWCCKHIAHDPKAGSHVTSLALVNKTTAEAFFIDCSPDFDKQYAMVAKYLSNNDFLLKGIFLTHAHVGHYLGLASLGREVMGSQGVPVYAMPGMENFLRSNGPWNQLVKLKNIDIKTLADSQLVNISEGVSVMPFLVPHRDEFSETVGYRINGPSKNILYIPDIDKWEKWNHDILQVIPEVDIALLDGTFFDQGELPGRNMAEIPHPFVVESMDLFTKLDSLDRPKIHFTHFNHSNPLLRQGLENQIVLEKGFNVAQQGMHIEL